MSWRRFGRFLVFVVVSLSVVRKSQGPRPATRPLVGPCSGDRSLGLVAQLLRTTLISLISGCVSNLTSGDFSRISTLSSSFLPTGVVLCGSRDDGIGNSGWNPFSGRVFWREGQRLFVFGATSSVASVFG